MDAVTRAATAVWPREPDKGDNMKPSMIRMSDACEVAFMGFALDAQDNGAGLWDGNPRFCARGCQREGGRYGQGGGASMAPRSALACATCS